MHFLLRRFACDHNTAWHRMVLLHDDAKKAIRCFLLSALSSIPMERTSNALQRELVTAPNNSTMGAWSQLNSNSSQRIKALILAWGAEDMSLLTDQWYHIEVGWYWRQAQKLLLLNLFEAGGCSSGTKTPCPGFLGPIYADICWIMLWLCPNQKEVILHFNAR